MGIQIQGKNRIRLIIKSYPIPTIICFPSPLAMRALAIWVAITIAIGGALGYSAMEIKHLNNKLPVPVKFINLKDGGDDETTVVSANENKYLGIRVPFEIFVPAYNEQYTFNDMGDDQLRVLDTSMRGTKLKYKEVLWKDRGSNALKPAALDFHDYDVTLWMDRYSKWPGMPRVKVLWLKLEHCFSDKCLAYQISGFHEEEEQ